MSLWAALVKVHWILQRPCSATKLPIWKHLVPSALPLGTTGEMLGLASFSRPKCARCARLGCVIGTSAKMWGVRAAGATAASITMPLDFAKTVLQCGSELPVHRVLKQTLQDKGPAGLFTGMVSSAQCLQALFSRTPCCTCPAVTVAAPALCT